MLPVATLVGQLEGPKKEHGRGCFPEEAFQLRRLIQCFERAGLREPEVANGENKAYLRCTYCT